MIVTRSPLISYLDATARLESMSKFSVIMPVLNGARFIEAAINSVRAQTCDDWEMMIIDGGSDDGTLEIIAMQTQGDPRIAFVSEPDEGMYDALLKGVSATTGEWICWLNSDDMYTPWAFSTIADYAGRNDAAWITGYPSCWDESGNLRYIKPLGSYSRRLIAAGWHHEGLLGHLQQESIFFKRSLLEKLGTDDIEAIRRLCLAGDFLLWRLLAKHAALSVLPTVLGGFRRHSANMSEKQRSDYLDELNATRPYRLPPPASLALGYLYRLASLRRSLKIIEKSDADL